MSGAFVPPYVIHESTHAATSAMSHVSFSNVNQPSIWRRHVKNDVLLSSVYLWKP